MDRRLLLIVLALTTVLAPAVLPAQGAPAPAAGGPGVPSSLLKGNPKRSPAVRQRLVELIQLPKDKLWAELVKWPAFQQMSLQEQAAFLQKLSEMRQRLRAQALKKASEMGLKLTPEQEDPFVSSYLKTRLELERQMSQDAQPKRHKLEEQLTASLRQEYGEGKVPPTAPEPTSPR